MFDTVKCLPSGLAPSAPHATMLWVLLATILACLPKESLLGNLPAHLRRMPHLARLILPTFILVQLLGTAKAQPGGLGWMTVLWAVVLAVFYSVVLTLIGQLTYRQLGVLLPLFVVTMLLGYVASPHVVVVRYLLVVGMLLLLAYWVYAAGGPTDALINAWHD